MKRKETAPEPPAAPADRALAEAMAAGEARRREWLATLDPRQREDLGMGD